MCACWLLVFLCEWWLVVSLCVLVGLFYVRVDLYFFVFVCVGWCLCFIFCMRDGSRFPFVRLVPSKWVGLLCLCVCVGYPGSCVVICHCVCVFVSSVCVACRLSVRVRGVCPCCESMCCSPVCVGLVTQCFVSWPVLSACVDLLSLFVSDGLLPVCAC